MSLCVAEIPDMAERANTPPALLGMSLEDTDV